MIGIGQPIDSSFPRATGTTSQIVFSNQCFAVSMIFSLGTKKTKQRLFHSQVNMNCWNTSQEIKDWLAKENKVGTEDDLLDLWRTFQNRAYSLAVQANDNKKVTGILWTNRMTELGVEKYLPNDEYIIQIWTTGTVRVL
jgi:hypothetical protein